MKGATMLHVVACVFASLLVVLAAKTSSGGSKACSHTGFFSKKVVPLCERHFPDASSKNPWLVQFYHPRASKLESKYIFEEVAGDPKKVEGAKVGAVDCEQNGEFCARNGIRTVPTTRMILSGSSRDFEAEESVENLRKFATESLSRFRELEEALKCSVRGVFTDPAKDQTVPLCTKRFPPSLEPVPWVVAFYDSGDRNKDKAMRTNMNKLAAKYGNTPPKKVDAKSGTPKFRVGAIECGNAENDCESLGITTYPTVRFYRRDAEPIDFKSSFDLDELKSWAADRLKEMPPPDVAPLLDIKPSTETQVAEEGKEKAEL